MSSISDTNTSASVCAPAPAHYLCLSLFRLHRYRHTYAVYHLEEGDVHSPNIAFHIHRAVNVRGCSTESMNSVFPFHPRLSPQCELPTVLKTCSTATPSDVLRKKQDLGLISVSSPAAGTRSHPSLWGAWSRPLYR